MSTARMIERQLRRFPDSVKVVCGTEATWGVRDVADVALFEEAEIWGVTDELRIATGTLTVSRGATVTVDGDNYTVMMQPQRQKDGTTLIALGA